MTSTLRTMDALRLVELVLRCFCTMSEVEYVSNLSSSS